MSCSTAAYPIEQLAVNADFMESCYLLLNGDLPNAVQKKQFVDTVTKHTMVHEQMQFFFRGFRRDVAPDVRAGWHRRRAGIVLPRLAGHQRCQAA
ncbi:citrate/2-methylcitrate synthase [Massilia eburnea]|uniref:citrate/2-methylcitrate synthase n=1 Tax=Massilia eburnea TaxID=1776165 RepID=UPI003D6BD740